MGQKTLEEGQARQKKNGPTTCDKKSKNETAVYETTRIHFKLQIRADVRVGACVFVRLDLVFNAPLRVVITRAQTQTTDKKKTHARKAVGAIRALKPTRPFVICQRRCTASSQDRGDHLSSPTKTTDAHTTHHPRTHTSFSPSSPSPPSPAP